jgi:hypothetical protein
MPDDFSTLDAAAEAARMAAEAVKQAAEAAPKSFRVLTADDLLRTKLPPREIILSPWLPTKGLAMVYGPRGIGKTHVTLGCAYAIASSGSFLRWRAPIPRRVLVIDGEMPAATLQERLARIVAATAILDRGLGKPKEGPSEENESDEIDLAHLTPEERGELSAALATVYRLTGRGWLQCRRCKSTCPTTGATIPEPPRLKWLPRPRPSNA